MLLNNEIQMQRPNTLHNEIQHTFYFSQHVGENIQLHKEVW